MSPIYSKPKLSYYFQFAILREKRPRVEDCLTAWKVPIASFWGEEKV